MMPGLKSGPKIVAKTGIPAGLLFRRIWYPVWKSGGLGIMEYHHGRPLHLKTYVFSRACDDEETQWLDRGAGDRSTGG